MKVAHIALWTLDLEQQAQFWVTFFDARINENTAVKPILDLNPILSEWVKISRLS